MTLTSYIYHDPTFKYGHIPRYGGLGLSICLSGGDNQFITKRLAMEINNLQNDHVVTVRTI